MLHRFNEWLTTTTVPLWPLVLIALLYFGLTAYRRYRWFVIRRNHFHDTRKPK